MKPTTLIIAVLALSLSACATLNHQPAEMTIPNSITLTDNVQPAETQSPSEPANPEQRGLLHLQDRLNVFASPRYIADVANAKAAGADALQVACMDSTVTFGADIKAKPLITLPSVDLGPVDRSCGWCLLATKRKADSERANGPSLLVRLAEGRKRLSTLTRTTLVACAPLTRDIELSAMTPENMADALIRLIELIAGRQGNE